MNPVSVFLRNVLRANDPALIDEGRLRTFHASLAANLGPQDRSCVRPAFARVRSSRYAPFMASVVVLALGLWVGREIGQSLNPTIPIAQTQTKESVLAMASPWQDFIVEGE